VPEGANAVGDVHQRTRAMSATTATKGRKVRDNAKDSAFYAVEKATGKTQAQLYKMKNKFKNNLAPVFFAKGKNSGMTHEPPPTWLPDFDAACAGRRACAGVPAGGRRSRAFPTAW